MYEPQSQSKEWDQKSINSKRHVIAKPKEYLNLLHDVIEQKSKEKIFDAVFNLLNNFDYIEVLISDEAEELGGGIDVLIGYYVDTLEAFSKYSQFVEQLEALELINNALSKIQNDIKEHSIELRQKLHSHLMVSKNSYIQLLLEQISNTENIWLRSVLPATVEVGHKEAINSIIVQKKLALTYSKNTIKKWNFESGTEISQASYRDSFSAFAVTITGQTVVRGYKNGAIKAVDVAMERVLSKKNKLHRAEINLIAISPDLNWLASYDKANKLSVFDLEKKEYRMFRSLSEPLYSLSFSADSQRLIAGVANQTIKVWDLTKQYGVFTFSTSLGSNVPVDLLTVVEGTNYIIAASSYSSVISVLEYDSGNIAYRLDDRSGNISILYSFNRDLLCAVEGKTLKIWALHPRKVITQWTVPNVITSCVAVYSEYLSRSDINPIILGDKNGNVYFLSLQYKYASLIRKYYESPHYRSFGHERYLFDFARKKEQVTKPDRVKPINTQLKNTKSKRTVDWLSLITRFNNVVTTSPVPIFLGSTIVFFLIGFAYAFLSYKTEPTPQVSQAKSPIPEKKEQPQSSPIPFATPEASPSPSEPSSPPSPKIPTTPPVESPSPSPLPETSPSPTSSKEDALRYDDCLWIRKYSQKTFPTLESFDRDFSHLHMNPEQKKSYALQYSSYLEKEALPELESKKFQSSGFVKLQPKLVNYIKEIIDIGRNYLNDKTTPDQFDTQIRDWNYKQFYLSQEVGINCPYYFNSP